MKRAASPRTHSDLSVLATKIYLPKVGPDIVPRRDLMDKLSHAGHRKLTIVCAPAGYGKSTAVAAWVQQAGCTTAWISLDRYDNDPMKFWSTVLTALYAVQPSLSRRAWDFMQVGLPASSDAVVSALVHDVYSVNEHIFLVLDDYHLINEPRIHEAMEYLIKQGPSTLHVIIISRASPPFSLGRLRVQGQVLELTTHDLRFEKTAILDFYRQVIKVELTPEDLNLIEHHTEGWIACMNLVGLALRGAANTTDFLRGLTGNHRFIAEYLVEEVIHCQPDYIQNFWLKTSILSRFNVPLCQAVTGDPNAGEILQRLDQSTSFLIPLDDKQQWFRYHHLFSSVLQELLLRRLPEEVMTLHRLACAWFQSMNLIPEAVEHAFRGKDYETAAKLIYDYAPKMLKNREAPTLLAWLHEFPDEILKRDPQLCITYAWGLALSGQLEQAEQFICLVDECLHQIDLPQDAYNQLWVESRVLRGYMAILRKDVKGAIHFIEQSIQRFPKYSRFFQFGAELNMGEPYVLRSRLGLRGYLTSVSELYPQLRQMWKNSGLGILGYGSVVMAELYYEWNDFEQLAYFIPRGIELGRMSNSAGVLVPIYFVYAKYLRATNNRRDMWIIVEELEAIVRQMASAHWQDVVDAFKTRLWIEEQHQEKVAAWVASSQMRMQGAYHAIKEFELITMARAMLYHGQLSEAQTLLANVSRWAETEDRLGTLIEVRTLQAMVCRQQGDLTAALTTMQQAVSMAFPHKYWRTFLDEGTPVLELLQRLLDQELSQESSPRLFAYVQSLLSIVEEEIVSAPSSPQKPHLALIEPLTKRESTILSLLSKGYTNAEIASALDLSVGTVKGYNHQIFGKLGVKNRVQAVSKAKEMNLLQ